MLSWFYDVKTGTYDEDDENDDRQNVNNKFKNSEQLVMSSVYKGIYFVFAAHIWV